MYRALLWVFYHLVAFPDRGVFTVPKIRRHLDELGGWRPDVVVVSGPPFSTYLVARRLSRQWKVPWVADYRDLWTNSSYYLCGPIRRRLDRVVERWILRTVALTVTVSEPLAEDLRREFGVRCEVVMNGYEAGEFEIETEPRRDRGASVEGRVHRRGLSGKGDPVAFLEALARLGVGPETMRVEFRGITVGPLAVWPGHGGRVTSSASARRSSCRLAPCNGVADVQLLLLWNDRGEVGTYSGKLFEYLGSGRPILMMGYPDGVAAQLIRDRNAGDVANTPDEVASALADWIDQKRSTGSSPGTGAEAIAGLTRRDQAEVLSGHLEELLRSEGVVREHGGARAPASGSTVLGRRLSEPLSRSPSARPGGGDAGGEPPEDDVWINSEVSKVAATSTIVSRPTRPAPPEPPRRPLRAPLSGARRGEGSRGQRGR